MQTGRSLAAICYGGCLFFSTQISDEQKKNVDAALGFLSKDSSDQQATSAQSLEEVWRMVDGLLSTLSLVVSNSCQTMLKNNLMQMD